jgi:LPS sulfotransferase NodH
MPHFPEAEKYGATLAGFDESIWTQERGISSFQDFLQLVFRECRTPNGVFGVKLSWNPLLVHRSNLSKLG